jgi:hypothetical protein
MKPITKFWLFFCVPGTVVVAFLLERFPASGPGDIPWVVWGWGAVILPVGFYLSFLREEENDTTNT